VANTTIVELMAAPVDSRDLSWLQESLQSALELELSTLPVYLSGMWSIKNQSGEVYELINSVVLEEMLHLGFACNMLTAVGGTPKIVAPVYPGHLPGGVLPKLDVYLSGLTATSLKMYMAIEEPEHPLTPAETDYPTIGMFYDAIAAVFQALSPPISPDGQLAATLSVPNPDGASTRITEPVTVVASLTDALAAIKTIKDQGEGTTKNPDSPRFGGELAHYYRFGEIRYGRKFVEVGGKWDYTGAAVPFPDCYPVARVPQGGYPELPASKSFNTAYSQLLAHLQDAWTGGGRSALSAAIGTMFQLYPLAAPIVATPLPDGSGNYGPDFIPG
jgi:Ferritin-like